MAGRWNDMVLEVLSSASQSVILCVAVHHLSCPLCAVVSPCMVVSPVPCGDMWLSHI